MDDKALAHALRLAVDPPGGVNVEALHDLVRDDEAVAWDIGDVLSRIDGHQGEDVIDCLADINPAMGHHVAAFAFGDIYDRPGLDARSRQRVTLGVLTALGGCTPQLKVHIGAALNVGITHEEITEAILHAAISCGFPRALNATFVAREVFQDREQGQTACRAGGTEQLAGAAGHDQDSSSPLVPRSTRRPSQRRGPTS